jgi:hypothetical protein
MTENSIPFIPELFLTVESLISLKATLKELLDVKPPTDASGAKDLASLQDQIRKIGTGALEEKFAEKLLGSIGKGSANQGPDESKLEKGVRGTLKKILNPPTEVALQTDYGDEKVIKLLKAFSDDYLKKDSEMIKVFTEYIELTYIGDRYPGKVCKKRKVETLDTIAFICHSIRRNVRYFAVLHFCLNLSAFCLPRFSYKFPFLGTCLLYYAMPKKKDC